MNRKLSVFALLCRSTLRPLLGVCLAVCGAQALAFGLVLRSGSAAPGLETALEFAWTAPLCGLGFALVTLLLCRWGWHGASRMEYTLQRLCISEKAVLAQHAVYSTLWYLVYWAMQLLCVAGLAFWYRTHYFPGPQGSQLLALAAWRSPLVHGLLPLADISRWVADAATAVTLGFQAAVFSHKRRHDRRGVSNLLPAVLTLVLFCRAANTMADVFLIFGALIVCGVSLLYLPNADLEEVDPAHETT